MNNNKHNFFFYTLVSLLLTVIVGIYLLTLYALLTYIIYGSIHW